MRDTVLEEVWECMTAQAKKVDPSRRRSKAVPAGKKREKPEHGTSLITAFQEIRELIVHGKMSPGTWLLEVDLAERLNMSRTPVRGAIHWLQREGYVLEQRGTSKSRMIVAPLTKEDANELYVIIGSLEGIAGRGAAGLPREERKTLVGELEAINKQLLAIAQGEGNAGRIFELDRNFHRRIMDAGGGTRLTALHRAIEPQVERYWRLYASSIIKDLTTSVDEHAGIIDGLRRGDPAAVEHGLQSNWQKGVERLERVIEMFGERGSW